MYDFVFFFFQAEDGIRDIGVTGVQTCALPILDRLIANAGIGNGVPIGTGAAATNRAILATNVLGTHAQCEAAVELFRAQGSGHLVLISSVAAVRGMRGTRTAYGASKAALNSLAEGIRSDVYGTPIAVSTILPEIGRASCRERV